MLSAACSPQLVHGDLKPDNILVDVDRDETVRNGFAGAELGGGATEAVAAAATATATSDGDTAGCK